MPKTGAAKTGAAKPRSRKAPRAGKKYTGNFVLGELRDFPTRTMKENQAEREALFAKAWAQKAAREASEARGEVFLPAWQKAAVARVAIAKAAVANTAATQKARLAALNRAADSDSD